LTESFLPESQLKLGFVTINSYWHHKKTWQTYILTSLITFQTINGLI